MPSNSASTFRRAHWCWTISSDSHSALNAALGSCGIAIAAPDIWSAMALVWSAAAMIRIVRALFADHHNLQFMFSPLFSPRTREYILRNPNTFKKYHEADDTHEASSDTSSTPLCNIGLNLNVRGKGTFAVMHRNMMFLVIFDFKIKYENTYLLQILRRPNWSTLLW